MLNYDPERRASSKQLIKVIGEIQDFSDVVSESSELLQNVYILQNFHHK